MKKDELLQILKQSFVEIKIFNRERLIRPLLKCCFP